MEDQFATLCTCCYTKYEPNDLYCNACGFPLQGTQQEKNNFRSERAVKEIDLADLNEKVETARKSLYWIAGLMGVFSTVALLMAPADQDKLPDLITTAILVVAFLALAIWGKTKPSIALISGLSLYLIIHILNAVINPLSIISGIIVKILIIGYLIKGIKSVIEADKIKKELNIS